MVKSLASVQGCDKGLTTSAPGVATAVRAPMPNLQGCRASAPKVRGIGLGLGDDGLVGPFMRGLYNAKLKQVVVMVHEVEASILAAMARLLERDAQLGEMGLGGCEFGRRDVERNVACGWRRTCRRPSHQDQGQPRQVGRNFWRATMFGARHCDFGTKEFLKDARRARRVFDCEGDMIEPGVDVHGHGISGQPLAWPGV